jgi:hypothetical protein
MVDFREHGYVPTGSSKMQLCKHQLRNKMLQHEVRRHTVFQDSMLTGTIFASTSEVHASVIVVLVMVKGKGKVVPVLT